MVASRGWKIRRAAQNVGLLALLCVATLWLGCAKSNPKQTAAPSSENYYCVATKSTGFYGYDPHQEVGPDKILPHDTVVVLLRPSFGYSVVRLLNGQQGYVSSKDLRVAPPALIPKAAPTPRPSGPSVDVYSPEPKPTPAVSPHPPSEFEPAPLANPH